MALLEPSFGEGGRMRARAHERVFPTDTRMSCCRGPLITAGVGVFPRQLETDRANFTAPVAAGAALCTAVSVTGSEVRVPIRRHVLH